MGRNSTSLGTEQVSGTRAVHRQTGKQSEAKHGGRVLAGPLHRRQPGHSFRRDCCSPSSGPPRLPNPPAPRRSRLSGSEHAWAAGETGFARRPPCPQASRNLDRQRHAARHVSRDSASGTRDGEQRRSGSVSASITRLAPPRSGVSLFMPASLRSNCSGYSKATAEEKGPPWRSQGPGVASQASHGLWFLKFAAPLAEDHGTFPAVGARHDARPRDREHRDATFLAG